MHGCVHSSNMKSCSTTRLLSATMCECTVYFDAFHFICLVFNFAHAFVYFLFSCNRCNKEHFDLKHWTWTWRSWHENIHSERRANKTDWWLKHRWFLHIRRTDDPDDVIKWKHFPRHWPFVRGIHRSPVNSPHKGPWRELWCFLWSAPE